MRYQCHSTHLSRRRCSTMTACGRNDWLWALVWQEYVLCFCASVQLLISPDTPFRPPQDACNSNASFDLTTDQLLGAISEMERAQEVVKVCVCPALLLGIYRVTAWSLHVLRCGWRSCGMRCGKSKAVGGIPS
jgi:hypothetical protein